MSSKQALTRVAAVIALTAAAAACTGTPAGPVHATGIHTADPPSGSQRPCRFRTGAETVVATQAGVVRLNCDKLTAVQGGQRLVHVSYLAGLHGYVLGVEQTESGGRAFLVNQAGKVTVLPGPAVAAAVPSNDGRNILVLRQKTHELQLLKTDGAPLGRSSKIPADWQLLDDTPSGSLLQIPLGKSSSTVLWRTNRISWSLPDSYFLAGNGDTVLVERDVNAGAQLTLANTARRSTRVVQAAEPLSYAARPAAVSNDGRSFALVATTSTGPTLVTVGTSTAKATRVRLPTAPGTPITFISAGTLVVALPQSNNLCVLDLADNQCRPTTAADRPVAAASST